MDEKVLVAGTGGAEVAADQADVGDGEACGQLLAGEGAWPGSPVSARPGGGGGGPGRGAGGGPGAGPGGAARGPPGRGGGGEGGGGEGGRHRVGVVDLAE